ncbi:amino acid/polyamine transporter I [Aspergillus avenaceus]|uniref:Amino acid/polyamine transporter I n=1 Tax=Aspergillus avenaceus TaxID=36643 RepID=A0A5N6U0H8_ASPAV|nr:amino acid/polyamine transporter I [Aspergillus avenaceus]
MVSRRNHTGASEQDALLATSDHIEDHSAPEPCQKRHIGLASTALLAANSMIGAAVFTVPSSIVLSVGSVGAALSLWILGLGLTFCGFFIWLELGCLRPASGGEKVYLEMAYPRPYRLASTLFGIYQMLGCWGLTSLVVTDNLLLAFDTTASDAGKRIISVAVLVAVTAMLSTSREWSLRFMNILASFKIAILVFIIMTALATVIGLIASDVDIGANFRHPFAGSSTDVYDYTLSLFKIFKSFQGWNCASLVLGEIANPQRTMKVAGPLGLGSVGILYFLVNVSYFLVAEPEDISRAGLQLVARLLGRIFGHATTRITAAMVALSSFGSLISGGFVHSRVTRELALEGVIPASKTLARTTRSGNPSTWTYLFTFCSTGVVILMVPFGDAYAFLIDVTQTQIIFIYLAVVVGLFIIRRKVPRSEYPFRVWRWVAYLFAGFQVYLLISPALSRSGRGDTSLPYWLAPILALASFGVGGLYWWWNRSKHAPDCQVYDSDRTL